MKRGIKMNIFPPPVGSNHEHPPSLCSCWHARIKPSSIYSCLEKVLGIYILPGGCKSMIRSALGKIPCFSLPSVWVFSIISNLISSAPLECLDICILALLLFLFLIKIGIYCVTMQNCRAKHPGPMTAQIHRCLFNSLSVGLCHLSFSPALYQL